MGGRALSVPTRRYERQEFEIISEYLITKLKQTFEKVAMPLYYRNKSSFGDADILISPNGIQMREYITETFKPKEIFHNGNCWSFDYEELQVDLITTSDENFDANYVYLGYNDLGNYIGRIAHGLGFKFGQEGLWYEHYFKGSNIGSIPISKDFNKVFDFLGLSFERWLEGFDDLEDIFKYIAESPFFNWKRFQLDELNKINRDRNKKRKSYMSFLEWIDNNVADADHEFQYNQDKTEYLENAKRIFPEANIEMEIRRLEYEECKSLYMKSKFNGGEVMRRFGLEGKELGSMLKGFKDSLFDNVISFDDFIITTDSEKLYKMFENFLKTYERN